MPLQQFRGNITGRSGHGASAGNCRVALQRARKSEVRDPQPHLRTDPINHDVVRLDVPMHDSRSVDCSQSQGGLFQDCQSFLR